VDRGDEEFPPPYAPPYEPRSTQTGLGIRHQPTDGWEELDDEVCLCYTIHLRFGADGLIA